MDFRWVEWNTQHIAAHGVEPERAEEVIENARSPFPHRIEDDKWLAWGSTSGGRLLQVIFVPREDGSLYVIHARPLTEAERKRWRRKER